MGKVTYYCTSGTSIEQIKAHFNKVYSKGTVITIHYHPKHDLCNSKCEEVEV